jgi:endoglucanase
VLRFRDYLGVVTAGGLVVALCAVIVNPHQGSSLPASVQPTPETAAPMVISDPAEPDSPTPAPQLLAPRTDLLGGGPLHTHGGDIVDAEGRVVHITGVNWFGLETSTFAPHGLWARGLDDMLDQIVQAGFNTIRLPFCNQLFDPTSTPNGIDFKKNPDLQGLTGVQIMDQVVQRAGERGLKVILDRHRPTAAGQSELWYTDHISERRWIDDWVSLASRYRGNPTVIGADLHNEPHGPATWGDGNPSTDWRAAAGRAGNAVLQANPDWLIFVEGIEHQANDWYWWGGNLARASQFPVELSVPDKLVYEAHDYGPGVSSQKWFQAPDFPANLAGLWYAHWAYLKDSGTAPLLVGEFGGRSVGSDTEGIWQRSLVTYLQANGFDYTYWSWNPNSGDTGGILEDDWTTLNSAKLAILRAYEWPLLGSPVPAATAQEIVAAYAGPTLSAPGTGAVGLPSAQVAAPSSPAPAPASGALFAIGGPFDPDPQHALLGAGGPNDPDPAHRQARQADELLYLHENGKPWDRAVYVTTPGP